jgi:thioesterase domain-containing protein/acyl carrier protein
VRRRLARPAAAADDDYTALGGDSLAAVEIVGELTDRLGVALGPAEFAELGTARAVAARLTELRATTAPPAARARPDGPRPPVTVRAGSGVPRFLVHPADGAVHCYVDLVRHSAGRAPVLAFDAPPDPGGSVEEVARHHLARLRAARPTGPFRLGGYSFGGTVALEMALRLQAVGEEVEELLLIDSPPPSAFATATAGRRPGVERLRTAAPAVLDVLRGPAGSPSHPVPRDPDARIARHAALAVYRPASRFVGDVTVLAAADPLPGPLLDQLGVAVVPPGDWAAHVTGSVRVVTVPGDHWSMVTAPHLPALAAAFDRWSG